MCIVRNKVLALVLMFAAISFTGVSTSFHYDSDIVETSVRDDGSIAQDYLLNPKLKVAKRYYREFSMNLNTTGGGNVFARRVKREDDSAFIGHPKTREERWYSNFNLNQTNLQMDQTQSLVNLLVKVMDKYLNSCIPIILYDRYVQQSEGIILQTFFKVSHHFIISKKKLISNLSQKVNHRIFQ